MSPQPLMRFIVIGAFIQVKTPVSVAIATRFSSVFKRRGMLVDVSQLF